MIQSMDLRRLCSTILANTIADPDMYQNGLTKIFFRAGMLAALESFRSDRLNAMVTVVQKNVRRRLAMKKYSQLRQATIKVQTWWRGVLARRFVESIRREVSAIRLQTAVRCFIQRNHFLDTRRRFILLQSRTWWRIVYSYSNLTVLQVFAASKHVNVIFRRGLLMQPSSFKAYYGACK
jgi:myosin-5